ncbi:unnamed protein product [Ascophyllum nodosum]
MMSGQPSNHDDGIPTMGRATDRTANDDHPPPVAVPDAGDATGEGHGTMSHEERSTIPLTLSPAQPPHEHVICEVRDLYYAIDLPAGGSPGQGDVNGWIPRAARFCRSLWQIKKDDGGDGNVGDGTAAERSTVSETSLKLELLEGVNCRVRAGDMVAVIGASGAGKSTFLDLLAGRKFDGEYAGQILQASGEASRGSSSRSEGGGRGRASVYVTQDDFHVAELTVRESLAFAVRLSMGVPGVTDRDRQVRVEELLNVLGLESCADVRVGNPLERGISGGQARRLSVGVGVSDLESVRLLLLDEPTTGLDSSSAMEVLNLARRLATRADRRAVVASVHQPSAEMFALFDKARKPRQAEMLLRPEVGIVPSPGQNPAEFILIAAKATVASRLRSGDNPGGPRETSYREEGASSYAARYSNGVGIDGEALLLESRTGREGNNVEQLMSIQAGTAGKGNFAWRGDKEAYAVGFCTQVSVIRPASSIATAPPKPLLAQFLAVWRRSWMVELRRTEALWALVVKNTLVGILTAAVFWQEGSLSKDEPLVDPLLNDVTPAASNVMGLLYFGTLYGLTGHLEAIPDMFEWRRHFERERVAGMYSTTVYWLVSSTAHMPVMFVGFVVYLNICYWSLGLPAETSKYLIFGGVILVTTLMGYSLAQMLSAAAATPQARPKSGGGAAFATWPLFLVTAANFTGFTVRLPAVRVWFRWLCEVSFCRWPYELMVVNQFHDFKEGPQLLDLYFGENRQTLLGIAGFVCLFYAAFLLLSLLFLQPRRSCLRVLDETPASSAARRGLLVESTPSAQDAVGGSGPLVGEEQDRGEEFLSQPDGGDRGGGGGGASRQGARMNARDPDLVEVAPGEGEDGTLYYLEEGRKVESLSRFLRGREGGARSAPTAEEATENATLRAPLLGGARRGNVEGDRMGGVCEGSTVAFRDLHYFIHLRGGEVGGNKPASPAEENHEGQAGGGELKREAHVLRGVTAVASPGQMVAVLGPSGSGKTTLLDLLGGRKTPSVGRREGDIIVDGVMARGGGGASPGLAGNAYVMQARGLERTRDNVHHTALTVRQTLGFAAKLRMSRTATARQREERVRSMVSMLGLGGVLDTKVGSESKRGISGGEAKRLSIAVEAMDLPGLLLLDEPTSGMQRLDATTALEVVVAVRSLADLGRTVVASLHQPSAEMFELFDTCLLLTKGGHQAYFGETDRAMAYFSSIGLVPSPAATDTNPADFLMSVASIGLPPPAAEAPGGGDGPLTLGAVIIPVPASTSDDAGAARTPRGSEDSVALDLGVGYVGKSLGREPSFESITALPRRSLPRVVSAFKPEDLQATFANPQ